MSVITLFRLQICSIILVIEIIWNKKPKQKWNLSSNEVKLELESSSFVYCSSSIFVKIQWPKFEHKFLIFIWAQAHICIKEAEFEHSLLNSTWLVYNLKRLWGKTTSQTGPNRVKFSSSREIKISRLFSTTKKSFSFGGRKLRNLIKIGAQGQSLLHNSQK